MTIVSIAAILSIIFVTCKAQSSEDQQSFSTVNQYAPSTVNFHDIYANTLLSEDSPSSPNDDEFPYNSIPTQYVEFHPSVLKISRITPPPRVLLNSSYLKKNSTEETTVSQTTEEPEPIKVIPIRNQPRGILDILFPTARVKSFKKIFDSVRHVLSYTFKK